MNSVPLHHTQVIGVIEMLRAKAPALSDEEQERVDHVTRELNTLYSRYLRQAATEAKIRHDICKAKKVLEEHLTALREAKERTTLANDLDDIDRILDMIVPDKYDPIRYYLATSLSNTDAWHEVDAAIVAARPTWVNTCEWAGFGSDMDRGEILRRELRGVRTADLVVVLFPIGRGTHVEIGYALAHEVPVLMLGGQGLDILAYQHQLIVRNRMKVVAEEVPTMMTMALERFHG